MCFGDCSIFEDCKHGMQIEFEVMALTYKGFEQAVVKLYDAKKSPSNV